MKIRFVDGHKIRNTINADFGVVASNRLTPYVPKGEMWIDKHYKAEKDTFVKIHLFELELLKKMAYSEARKVICKRFVKKIGILPKVVLKTKKIKGVTVEYVDGKMVRRYIDPKFVLGGHGYVYSYIPKKAVWIDNAQDKREVKYTLVHEVYERKLMMKGMCYNSAHDYALAAEKAARRNDGAHYPDD